MMDANSVDMAMQLKVMETLDTLIDSKKNSQCSPITSPIPKRLSNSFLETQMRLPLMILRNIKILIAVSPILKKTKTKDPTLIIFPKIAVKPHINTMIWSLKVVLFQKFKFILQRTKINVKPSIFDEKNWQIFVVLKIK